MVYSELDSNVNDDLWRWVRRQKNTRLFSKASVFVHNRHRDVVNYVAQSYTQKNYRDFMSGADAWLIAHAMQSGGRIVTFEVPDPKRKKAKIPDVSKHFGVDCIDLFRMLRSLGFSVKPRAG